MKLDAKQLAQILVDATAQANEQDIQKTLRVFVEFLAKHKSLGMWRDIERNIHTVWKDKFGASKVKIISAHELTQEAKKNLQDIVKGAEVYQTVNDKLIGGAVIRVDNRRIDGSILGKLQRLKRELTI